MTTFAVTGVGTPNLPFQITVAGSAISVQVQTDGGGVSLTTVGTMYNALLADGAVTALVTPSNVVDPGIIFLTNLAPLDCPPGTPVLITYSGESVAFTLTAPLSSVVTLAFKGMKVYPQ